MTGVMEQIMNEGLLKGRKEGLFKGKKQGLRQGLQKGKEQGLRQGQVQTAENMIKDGMLPFEKISLYSGMPVSEIQKIASRLGKN